MTQQLSPIASQLVDLVAAVGLPPLDEYTAERFATFYALLVRWNSKTNLTAIRDENEILKRHFLESILCASLLPPGLQTLLDYGSGAGFPGIPIALYRTEIAVTLAESQGKKAAFLNEAVRTLELKASVDSQRAEMLKATFDCVTLRAVDRMDEAVQSAATLVAPHGWLCLVGSSKSEVSFVGSLQLDFAWKQPFDVAGSDNRTILLGQRNG